MIDALYVPNIDDSLDERERKARLLGGVSHARRLARARSRRTEACSAVARAR